MAIIPFGKYTYLRAEHDEIQNLVKKIRRNDACDEAMLLFGVEGLLFSL